MIELETVAPQEKDLGGGFLVRRLLPSAARTSVGPFVIFDPFGPITLPADANADVCPHPQTGETEFIPLPPRRR